MSRRMALLVAAAVVVAAGLAGWLRPLDLPVTATGGGAGQWRLPTQAQLDRSTVSQFAATRAVQWFGTGTAATPGAAPTGSAWTLLGLVGRQDDRAVLVKAGNDPLIMRLGVGDTLPDGSRLVSVGSDGIVIELDGCQRSRPLYPVAEDTATDPTEGDDCLPAGEH